jgi:GNAT superfamily N-acetyltransferase
MAFDSLENIKRFFHLIAKLNNRSLFAYEHYDSISFPDSIWPNLIFNIKLEPSEILPWINSIQEDIKNLVHPKYIMCNDLDSSSELMAALKKFQPNNRHWTSMTYDLNRSITIKVIPNFTINQIHKKEEIDQWIDVSEQSLMQGNKLSDEMIHNMAKSDKIEFYLGYENEKAVSVSMLFLDDEWAGIYFVGTLKKFERKGYGKALTQFAMQRGAELGCKRAILQATQAGEFVYNNIGYQNHGRIELFNLEQK